jgi:hypothetical protein
MSMHRATYHRFCQFCGKGIEGTGRYVYPVPGDRGTMDNRVGKLACLDCGAQQYTLQVEQGLVRQTRQEAKQR